MAKPSWTMDQYKTPAGEQLIHRFIGGLSGRDKVEAFALIKLLEEQGNELRRRSWR